MSDRRSWSRLIAARARLLPMMLLLSITACAMGNDEKDPGSLPGTSWWVEDIAGKGVIDMSHTTIEFTDEGRIAGSTGCNRYFGSVEIDRQKMSMGPLAGTRKACADSLMDQEIKFFQAMEKVSNWEIAKTGLLHLRDADGKDQLRASRVRNLLRTN